MAAARVDCPKGVSAPASDKPMTSMTRSFVAFTTSSGKSLKSRLEAQMASLVERGKRDDHSAGRFLSPAPTAAACATASPTLVDADNDSQANRNALPNCSELAVLSTTS